MAWDWKQSPHTQGLTLYGGIGSKPIYQRLQDYNDGNHYRAVGGLQSCQKASIKDKVPNSTHDIWVIVIGALYLGGCSEASLASTNEIIVLSTPSCDNQSVTRHG
jgi:hypothetical protein